MVAEARQAPLLNKLYIKRYCVSYTYDIMFVIKVKTGKA